MSHLMFGLAHWPFSDCNIACWERALWGRGCLRNMLGGAREFQRPILAGCLIELGDSLNLQAWCRKAKPHCRGRSLHCILCDPRLVQGR
jgi:hypothetical protein